MGELDRRETSSGGVIMGLILVFSEYRHLLPTLSSNSISSQQEEVLIISL